MSDAHGTSDTWNGLCDALEQLGEGTALETPVSERQFEIDAVVPDRVDVTYRDSGEELSLYRDQFEILFDRLAEEEIDLATLQPGVEPYAAVASLSPEYSSAGGTLARAPEEARGGMSPHLVSPKEARTQPERVHDDAVLLADCLDRLATEELSALETAALTDLYVLLSDVQRGADRMRRTVTEPLLDRLGPDQQLHGRFGTVRRTTRERRTQKDDAVVLDALDRHGIPHDWVLGVDPDKLDVVLAVTDLEESAVYDVDEQVYVQKTGVDGDEKLSRLQGLADRLAELDESEGLRDELDALEQRIDEALSAG